jgi:hypothetical protein
MLVTWPEWGIFMRTTIAFVIICFGLCLASIAQNNAESVTFRDGSAPWSPLDFSGVASFTEELVGNSVTSQTNYELSARNQAQEPIILLVAAFDEAGSYPGDGIRHLITRDFAFAPLMPGQSAVVDQSVPGITIRQCCVNPLAQPGKPTAEVSLRYVEFANGDWLGDRSFAKGIKDARVATLGQLRRFDASTDEDFPRLLASARPVGPENLILTIRRIQQHDGTAAARAEVRGAIDVARTYPAAFQ